MVTEILLAGLFVHPNIIHEPEPVAFF